eukprot:GHVU01038105.1.p5 GENE.GHVU01038105.1~~GHVU01038105.1.p5  ORF type:complete len:117 (-),score=11.96 GHVU01038105.1:1397-1747(-)
MLATNVLTIVKGYNTMKGKQEISHIRSVGRDGGGEAEGRVEGWMDGGRRRAVAAGVRGALGTGVVVELRQQSFIHSLPSLRFLTLQRVSASLYPHASLLAPTAQSSHSRWQLPRLE